MRVRRAARNDSIYESFSDMALLMLATFVFLFVMILIVANIGGKTSPEMLKEIEDLKRQVAKEQQKNKRLLREMSMLQAMGAGGSEAQTRAVLASAGLGRGMGRHDFDIFVKGLRNLPGRKLHLVVDATGSMHGLTQFLIPVLRVIAYRSGKEITAVSWYADNRVGTYHGTMGDMFDKLMQNAPFFGADETIGHAFAHLVEHEPVPSAYLLIGDEPPTDTVHYHSIPAPVFTLPLGVNNPEAKVAFRTIAEQTGGRMLQLKFQ
jgi:hypothetical protein